MNLITINQTNNAKQTKAAAAAADHKADMNARLDLFQSGAFHVVPNSGRRLSAAALSSKS